MSIELSVVDAKELRKKAEAEITKIVLAFEQRTGVRVEGIELMTETSMTVYTKITAKI